MTARGRELVLGVDSPDEIGRAVLREMGVRQGEMHLLASDAAQLIAGMVDVPGHQLVLENGVEVVERGLGVAIDLTSGVGRGIS